jgi:hypothetical protein
MSVPSSSRSLFHFLFPGTRPTEGKPPPCNARRRPPPVRPRLEVEALEGRLCPMGITLNITDPSQLPLQLPCIFSRGERIQFIVHCDSNDATEGKAPDNEPEYLTLTSSTGDFNVQIPFGQTLVFYYKAIQNGETFSVTSNDRDETGIINVTHRGAPHPFSVSGAFWNSQKLANMNELQTFIKSGVTLPVPATILPPEVTPLLSLLPRGYVGAALNIDNPYFHGDPPFPATNNQAKFTFQDGSFNGKTLTGHEVNYYFQGMIAAAYGVPEFELEGFVRAYYFSKHHQLPSANVLLAAHQGFANYQADLQYWQQQTNGVPVDSSKLPPTPPAPVSC